MRDLLEDMSPEDWEHVIDDMMDSFDLDAFVSLKKKRQCQTFFLFFIFSQNNNKLCKKEIGFVSLKNYNLKRFLACMILLTTRSVLVFLPGNRLTALIILVSAFHLSCKFRAWL